MKGNTMFGFWKNKEKLLDEQMAEMKENISLLVDETGEVRDGVTPEQVREATAKINELGAIYQHISIP